MFNRYIINSKEYIPYEKEVKEIKAPTDDSIKLYEEIKEKAYKNILYSIELRDNVFDFNAIIYRDMASYSTFIKYVFTLNGKKIDNKIEIERTFRDLNNEQEMIKKIIEHASLTLSSYLIPKLSEKQNLIK